MRSTAVRSIMGVALTLVLGGCTSATGGAPAPASAATSTGPVPSQAAAELTLDGIAPCDLITPDVQAQFNFYQPPSYLEGGDYLSQCTASSVDFLALGVGLAKTEGIAVVSGAQQTALTIAGLDSIEVRGDPTSCTEAVGVNASQSLRISAFQASGVTQDELCQSARQFAEVMVKNVRALQGR